MSPADWGDLPRDGRARCGMVAEHCSFFVTFGADPARLARMLRRMAGVDDGVHDRVTDFSRPVRPMLFEEFW